MFCRVKMCPERSTILQFYHGTSALISLMINGMNMGYSSVALPLLMGSGDLAILNGQPIAATWFASIISIAIPLGCVCSVFTMKVGRKKAMISSSVFFIAGWIIIATSNKIIQLLIGRFITGFAHGLAAAPAPVYLGEIATSHYKTTLTACTNVAICLGVLLIYLLGYTIPNNWQCVAAAGTVFPIISALFAIFFMAESPRWLLHKGRQIEARRELLRIRGLHSETDEFIDEFTRMLNDGMMKNFTNNIVVIDNINDTAKVTKSRGIVKKIHDILTIVVKPEVWKPFAILNIYFLFQQFCGIYIIIAYAVDLVVDSGITIDPFLITVLIGVVQTIGGFILILTSSRLGRRPSSIISGVGLTISIAILAVYLDLKRHDLINENYSAIPIVSIFVFVAMGSFGFLALPWAMIGELYPTKYVDILGPFTTCLTGLFNFASLQIYPILVDYDFTVTIYFYTAISFIATIYIYCSLPETHGRSHEEIEQIYRKV